MTGNTQDDHWLDNTSAIEFHDLSAVIHKTLDKFKISAYNSKVIKNEIYQYGLEISVSNHSLVQLGKLTPEVCAKAEVRQSVFYADIDWDWLVQRPQGKIEFSEVAKYPEVRRDLSLVLDKHIPFSDIEAIAYQTEDRILRRINVFDVYEGEKIDGNKKAYALSFILQDENRTLTDKIIDKCINRLMQNFEQQLGAIIRK
jgi:phenylalanyl-tRNA synthetase beta chain